MIESILEWSLRNRFLVLVLAAIVVAIGIGAMRTLPIDAVPDVTNVQVQVLTTAPALGPEEVERFVTTKANSESLLTAPWPDSTLPLKTDAVTGLSSTAVQYSQPK